MTPEAPKIAAWQNAKPRVSQINMKITEMPQLKKWCGAMAMAAFTPSTMLIQRSPVKYFCRHGDTTWWRLQGYFFLLELSFLPFVAAEALGFFR
jgi:hypothetical protein